MSDLRDLIGREPCCDQDMGGSHYHCGRCGKISSMMGHYAGVHRGSHPMAGKRVEMHFCCPDDCELEHDD